MKNYQPTPNLSHVWYKVLFILSLIISTFISIFFLDSYTIKLALSLQKWLHLSPHSSSNKHLFVIITYVCYCLLLIGYLLFSIVPINNKYAKLMRCFFISTIIISLAFFSKEILKDFFGRSGLSHARIFNFHLLAMNSGRLFPSGHMTILTAVSVTLSHFYPKTKIVLFSFTFLCLIIMVLMQFHFLSDCLAGVTLGLIIAYSTLNYKNKLFSPRL